MANPSITRFERTRIEGGDLEYEVRGEGEPVLFIHGSIIARAFAPLLSQPSLTEHYRLVNYHRRGFAGSTHATGPVSITQQAADARALLDFLGIQRAHVAGHSYGGLIALQLALDAPQYVQSLALLEAGTLWCDRPAEATEALQPIVQLYEAGDRAGALEAFGQMVAGPRFREAIDRALAPGWFEQAVADVDTFFQIELPAMVDWRFTPESAMRITQPVLSVLGSESAAVDPWAVEEHELLQAWMPQTEAFVLPGATHALQMMNPAGMAEGLAGFFERHPISISA
jgi:pimeloyl-ACP methyl ester carboxylesterase